MSAPLTQTTFVVGVRAGEVRRQLGPLQWCALEILVANAGNVDAGLVVEASVRSVSEELAVARNTAQRALRALRAAGLIEHQQTRGDAGQFEAASYRVLVGADVLRACLEVSTVAADDSTPRRAVQQPAVTAKPPAVEAGQQLVLLLPA